MQHDVVVWSELKLTRHVLHVLTPSQKTDATVHVHNVTQTDIERATAYSPTTLSAEAPDPFSLRNGVKTEDELSQLRQRRKNLENFHRRQNNVSPDRHRQQVYLIDENVLQLISYVLTPMDEHTEQAKVETEASRLPVRVSTQPAA